jgi:Pyruvate/2-oxoacid:ferredoxin oxidoreductase delta subunit
MGKKELNMHYVCTLDEAEGLAKDIKKFWVSNCGCREGKGKCKQSRMDVCVAFYSPDVLSGSNAHEISRKEMNEIFKEAKEKKLVPRPYRNDERTITDGLCFCCNDCCSYFEYPDESCDKGKLIEKTDMKPCSDCGICEDICHFGARIMHDGQLKIITKKCYGCGLCVDVCPEECIEMVKRK